jgi:hypothetical protein
VENPQLNRTAIENTDEEIWRAIRDLDPDQRRNASDVACVIAIVVACVVWYWLIFAASKSLGKLAGGSPTMIRKAP